MSVSGPIVEYASIGEYSAAAEQHEDRDEQEVLVREPPELLEQRARHEAQRGVLGRRDRVVARGGARRRRRRAPAPAARPGRDAARAVRNGSGAAGGGSRHARQRSISDGEDVSSSGVFMGWPDMAAGAREA